MWSRGRRGRRSSREVAAEVVAEVAVIKQVTKEMVNNWVGNQGYAEIRDDFMLQVLTEIAQKSFTADELKKDVINYDS